MVFSISGDELKVSAIGFSLVAASALLVLSGCAVKNDKTGVSGLGLTYSSYVKQLSDGTNYVEAEAALTAGRIGGAKGVVMDRAREYCDQEKKAVKVLTLEEDSHLLLNGVVRMTFRCQ
jgi:hypothetical protein